MAADRSSETLIALHRFGFGARKGGADAREAARDPRGFVLAEFNRGLGSPAPGLPASVDLPAVADQQAKRDQELRAAPPNPATKGPAPPNLVNEAIHAEAASWLGFGHAAPSGVCERLVNFWANHFTVSAARGGLPRIMAGAYVREAIRPHVFGRFADMAAAVVRHPAMLTYLDNHISIGPGSKSARAGRGLNENLAREILELHTVGTGHSQADVNALARMLTGWTMAGRDGRLGRYGSFVFDAAAHEPGAQVLMGRSYVDAGENQAALAVRDLAALPATMQRIAWKLARHFIADQPPRDAVDALFATLRETGGDLRAVSRRLLTLDACWRAPLTKIRTPQDHLVAIWRLLNQAPEPAPRAQQLMARMGQPLWSPPSPAGYSDLDADWATPNAVKVRYDVVVEIARSRRDDPRGLLQDAFGPAVSAATRDAVMRAESREQGLALLLLSPEFMRR